MGHRDGRKIFGTLNTNKWRNLTQENNQLYQDYGIEKFRNISLQIKMQVRKPSRNNSARHMKVEGGSIANRNTLCIE